MFDSYAEVCARLAQQGAAAIESAARAEAAAHRLVADERPITDALASTSMPSWMFDDIAAASVAELSAASVPSEMTTIPDPAALDREMERLYPQAVNAESAPFVSRNSYRLAIAPPPTSSGGGAGIAVGLSLFFLIVAACTGQPVLVFLVFLGAGAYIWYRTHTANQDPVRQLQAWSRGQASQGNEVVQVVAMRQLLANRSIIYPASGGARAVVGQPIVQQVAGKPVPVFIALRDGRVVGYF
ncbi:hypothetical protein MTP03_31990 [Tsukamurella sp. PLM1]|nr:hypothetical protein MTP03_31990 [Tsukamurella sp. PLM1]